jgi:hypothetical protein
MEVYNQNIPAGTQSIAGALSAPSSIEIPVGSTRSVSIKHVAGNQGVLINSVTLAGARKADFNITGGFNGPLLIPIGAKLDISIQYTDTLNNATVQLGVTFSSNQFLSIQLVGRASAAAPTPLPTPRSTLRPTPPPTPQPPASTISTPPPTPRPSPPPTPQPAPALAISNLIIVDAATNLDIRPVNDCNGCLSPTTLANIRADPFGTVRSVKLAIEGTNISLSRLENTPPYALFGDVGGDYLGQKLTLGDYKVYAQAFSESNGGGTAGPVRMETFTV